MGQITWMAQVLHRIFTLIYRPVIYGKNERVPEWERVW